MFLDYLDKPYLAYDIEPEDDRVQKADWLEVNLNYKKGRCIIGNPPFGKCLKIEENRRTGHQIKDNKDFDIGLCTFGAGIIGKIPEYAGQYAKEMYFKICDDTHREDILRLLMTTDWKTEVCNSTSGQQNLTQWQVCKYLKEQIPELE